MPPGGWGKIAMNQRRLGSRGRKTSVTLALGRLSCGPRSSSRLRPRAEHAWTVPTVHFPPDLHGTHVAASASTRSGVYRIALPWHTASAAQHVATAKSTRLLPPRRLARAWGRRLRRAAAGLEGSAGRRRAASAAAAAPGHGGPSLENYVYAFLILYSRMPRVSVVAAQ
ncbi:unnamed protein product [Prorocentrum cordatum]|uniref:Uncharacterized protein n=1 Tax=Prorocentrum cordatum TaxID=2364126 RepID=A0ABN9S4L7_9DINO|nr:unnamed protein product [Polarella glacialis]